jgi:hypothetical protein
LKKDEFKHIVEEVQKEIDGDWEELLKRESLSQAQA